MTPRQSFTEQITVGIEGMACGMCEAHINEAVLKKVVAEAGYDVTSVNCEPYEKKGLFSKR